MVTFAPESIISNRADSAQSVFAIDIDGDGDIDVLSASSNDNKLAWYENDSNQNFTEQIISTTVEEVDFVFADDVDGDGEIDIFSAFSESNQDRIAWYENDGNQNFSERIIFAGDDDRFRGPSIVVTDIDSDNDPDVLSTSSGDNQVTWHQNDGTGNFTELNLFTTTESSEEVSSVLFAADIDSDSDTDVLSVITVIDDFLFYDNRIVWLENDGNYNLSEQTISNIFDDFVSSFLATDLDADNDIDILTNPSFVFDGITWYDNDGNQNFGERTIFTTISPNSILATDLDEDGDTDVLSHSFDAIAIYENDGNVNFTESILATNTRGITSIFTVDLDEDGDKDILSSSAQDDKIVWYENLTLDDDNGDDNNTSIDNFLIGTLNNDTLEGSDDDDILLGLTGNDDLNGNAGNDLLFGGQDNDTLKGGGGNDFLNGDINDDQLLGNSGNDTLDGGEGQDVLHGGQGEDILDGGLGNDFLFSDLGADQFVLRSGNGTDTILDYIDGTDLLLLDGLTFNQLTISAGIGQTVISSNDEVLAFLIGVNATDFSSDDFVTL